MGGNIVIYPSGLFKGVLFLPTMSDASSRIRGVNRIWGGRCASQASMGSAKPFAFVGSLFDGFRAAVMFRLPWEKSRYASRFSKEKLHRIFLPLPVFCMEADGALKGIRRAMVYSCASASLSRFTPLWIFANLYLGVFSRQRKIDLDIFAAVRSASSPELPECTPGIQKPASGALPVLSWDAMVLLRCLKFSALDRNPVSRGPCPVLIFFLRVFKPFFWKLLPKAYLP